MQHTLVAVFDNRTDAQSAMNELLSSGFDRTDVRLSTGDAADTALAGDLSTGSDSASATRSAELERSDDGDTGITASIKNFFSDLFGSDHAEHASRYEGAVSSGNHVLTLTADSLPEVERAADIVERYGPTDIDETSSGTPDMSAGMSAGAMGLGAGAIGAGAGMQQSSSLSAQSAPASGSMSGSNLSSPSSVQAGAIPQLDNPGDRNIFQQQSLNQAEPMGTTYQEPQGSSGLGATGATSLQGSTLHENAIQGSSLEGTQTSAIQAGGTQSAGTSPMAGSALGQAAGGSAASSMGANGMGESRQRDTSLAGADTTGLGAAGTSGAQGGALSGSGSLDKQRSGLRIFSRDRNGGSPSTSTGSMSGSASGSTLGSTSGASSDAGGTSTSAMSGSSIGSTSGSTLGSTSTPSSSSSTGMGMDDDNYYRQHFDSNYSAAGAKYDDFVPAYSYGSESARSERYTNRAWDDVEGDLRSDWENRIDGRREFSTTGSDSSEPSAWDRVKNAVRHGWDKMTDEEDNDAAYRNHYSSTYGATGEAYDVVRPAYAYGASMARDDSYRGRQWDTVEADLRNGWETRNGSSGEQSTWDKMKAAVRHGWDSMTGDDDDVYYRNHWNSVYGAGGESYDAYQPAYSYGSTMAQNDKYRGRQWNEVETDLRTDWDTRYPGEQSTWDKMKSAVRAGWDRMMR